MIQLLYLLIYLKLQEYLFAAMYWTRIIYPTYPQYLSMSPQVIIQLIHTARQTILDNFDSSPSSSGLDNFSPIGNAAAEYFAHDPKAWGSFVGSYFPQGNFNLECLHMAERVLCETGPWGANQCTVTNRSFIEQLRAEYGVCCSCP